MNCFSIKTNRGTPFFLPFAVPDAPVFRGGVNPGMACVSCVVGGRGGAEVGLAIVPAVMIDVVDKQVVRHVDYFAVHRYVQPLFQFRRPLTSYGVIRTLPWGGVPFVFADAFVVVRVNDGVFALREWYPAESVAVAQLSV